MHISLPATAPDTCDSVIALDIEGVPQADQTLLQQPDGVIGLPAYTVHPHKTPESKMKLDSRGVVEVVTSEQKYGNGWDGGQQVVIDVGGKTIQHAIAADAKEDNPSNPYWPYVISKVGRVTLDQAGSYSLR